MIAGRQGKMNTLDTGLRQRVATGAALLFGLVMFGTAGYVLIEGWSFLDALYMTVTTVATVGFREVNPLSSGGRIFTLFLIVFGVGVFFYAFAALVQIAVEGEVGRRGSAAVVCERRSGGTCAWTGTGRDGTIRRPQVH